MSKKVELELQTKTGGALDLSLSKSHTHTHPPQVGSTYVFRSSQYELTTDSFITIVWNSPRANKIAIEVLTLVLYAGTNEKKKKERGKKIKSKSISIQDCKLNLIIVLERSKKTRKAHREINYKHKKLCQNNVSSINYSRMKLNKQSPNQ